MARVFEDLDLPGLGQPFRAVVTLTLVDAITKQEVREAYFDGKTIIGTFKVPIDGNASQWTRLNQGMARAQWEAELAANSLIKYKGYPGGTYWRRRVESQTASRYQKVKKTTSYIEVPDFDGRLYFPELVVMDDVPESIDAEFTFTQGDDWERTMRSATSLQGYTYELELRRAPGSAVAATAVFDYTNADDDPDFRVGIRLESEETALMRGRYIGKLQQTDPDGDRKTKATWLFNVEVDA